MWVWLSSKDGMVEHLINLDHVCRAEIVVPCEGEEPPTKHSMTLYTVDGGKLEVADPADSIHTIGKVLESTADEANLKELAEFVDSQVEKYGGA